VSVLYSRKLKGGNARNSFAYFETPLRSSTDGEVARGLFRDGGVPCAFPQNFPSEFQITPQSDLRLRLNHPAPHKGSNLGNRLRSFGRLNFVCCVGRLVLPRVSADLLRFFRAPVTDSPRGVAWFSFSATLRFTRSFVHDVLLCRFVPICVVDQIRRTG
jgi:hypothetical protein